MAVKQSRSPATPEVQRIIEVAVYRAGRRYRAVCLTLSLIVERSSARAALDELILLAHEYVRDSLAEGLPWDQIIRPVANSERRYVYGRLAIAEAGRWFRSLPLIASLVARLAQRPTGHSAGDAVSSHQFCPI